MSTVKLFIQVFTCMGAIAGWAIGLILGILVLMPSETYIEQDTTSEVIIIVFSLINIIGLAGALVGAIISFIISIIILLCIKD